MKINLKMEKVMAVIGIKKRKPSILKEVLDNPEKFKLEAFVEGDEIIMKIKKREL